MKERPILMSAPGVIDTLEDRKTQTRRVVKLCDSDLHKESAYLNGGSANIALTSIHSGIIEWRKQNGDWFALSGYTTVANINCPYGEVGDRLWVREKWRVNNLVDHLPPRELMATHRIWYEADVPHQPHFGRLRHALHMPRWASRITLEIVGIRVERLQDISYEDACAEGCALTNNRFEPVGNGETWEQTARRLRWPQRSFCQLWNSINGPGSWDINSWVWVIDYKRVKP